MKWLTFVRERFDPGSHFLMIFLFVAGHVTVHAVENKLDGALTELARLPGLLALFFGATAFFFKLRLYDEIKDYEVDLEFNPGRPLARGLVTHRDLHIGIVVCIIAELGLFAAASRPALPAIGIAIGYSLLMYKEFFIGRLIRPHLTTYAVSHTVVTVLLSLALFCGLTGKLPWELSRAALFFALGNWCLFNIFEFGRKTFATDEERDRVESYSKIFGRFGAVVLVLSQAGLSSLCVFKMELPGAAWLVDYVVGLTVLLLLVGSCYAVTNRRGPAKLYRAMSSIHIILVFVGFLVRFCGALL